MEKLKFKCGFAKKKINSFLKKLPANIRKNFESEEERKRRSKLKEIKETMWKKTRKEGEPTRQRIPANEEKLQLDKFRVKIESLGRIGQRL